MNEGTGYLFKNIYCRLSSGEDVRFSDLDFNAFDAEDIDSLKDLFHNIFEECNYEINSIANALRQIAPVCKPSAYV
jgi:hypothetical protein